MEYKTVMNQNNFEKKIMKIFKTNSADSYACLDPETLYDISF